MSASLLDSARFRHAVQLAFRSNTHLLLEVEWAQDATTRASAAPAPATGPAGTPGPSGVGFNFALTVAEAIDALVTDVRVFTVSCDTQTTIEHLMLPNSAPAGSLHPTPAAAHPDKQKSNSRLRNPDRRRASVQSMAPLPPGDLADIASPSFSHSQAHPHAYQPVPSSYDVLVVENLDRAPQQVQAAVLLALDRQAARLKRLQAQQRSTAAQQQRELNMVGVAGRGQNHSHGAGLGANAQALGSRHGDGGGASLGGGAHGKRDSRLEPFESYRGLHNAAHADLRGPSHSSHAGRSNMDGIRHMMGGMGVGRGERRIPSFQLIATTSRSGGAAAQVMAPPSAHLRHGSNSSDNRENIRGGHIIRGGRKPGLHRPTTMLKRFCSEPVVTADYGFTPDHGASAAADPPPPPPPPPQAWQVHVGFYPGLADMFGISVALQLMPSAAAFNDDGALEAEQQQPNLYGHHHRNPAQMVQAQARVRARVRAAAQRAKRRAPEHAQSRAFAADSDQPSSVRSNWSGSVFGGVGLQAPSYTELADHATLVHTVHVSSAVRRVAQDLVSALRIHAAVVPPVLSASASAALIYAAQAVALTQNKHFAVPAHVCSVASMVLRHRICVRPESGQTADMVVSDILERLPMPV